MPQESFNVTQNAANIRSNLIQYSLLPFHPTIHSTKIQNAYLMKIFHKQNMKDENNPKICKNDLKLYHILQNIPLSKT